MEMTASPAFGVARSESPPASHRGQWLRPVAVVIALIFVISMSAAWIRVARGASHSLQAYRSSSSPDVLTMAYPNQGLVAGDRILAVDGIPASEPAADEAFWRERSAGDHLTLRVQRAENGQIEDVVVAVRPPLTDPAILIIFVASTIWAIGWTAVPVFVALVRPDEPAAGPNLLAGAAAGLSIPPAIWTNLPTDTWHLGIRAAYFLPAFSGIAILHQFLIFPSAHPLMLRLRRLGSILGGRLSAGVILLYAVPTAIAFGFSAGPLPTIGLALLVYVVCLVVAMAAMIRSYRHPASILTRPQLVWIFWAYVATCTLAAALIVVILVVGEPASFLRSFMYLGWALVPLATGFAVLRYRLFDVGRVVRDSVTYGLLTACLIFGYFTITLAVSDTISSLVGRATAVQSATIAAFAAATMAILAIPLHRRIQAGLDHLVYRSRVARRRFMRDADAVLSRAQPLDALVRFLIVETTRGLELTNAWLILAPVLRSRSDGLPGPPATLLQRLATTREPAIIARESLSGSAFPVLSGFDPALAPWYDAGARLVVPLWTRAAGDGDPGGEAEGTLIGVWVLGLPRSGELPEREDLVAVARVGQQAAVLLDYARLNQEQVRQALIQQDLERAREIQSRLLAPPHAGWPGELEIAARLQPARVASGDFYDVFELIGDGQAGGTLPARPPLQVVVGDVQGKGIAAALVMSMAMAALRTAGEQVIDADGTRPSPAETLSVVSHQLYRRLGQSDFVCCALAIVDRAETDGRPYLRLANAGQVPPLLCRSGSVAELVPPGDALPLGSTPTPDYRDLIVELEDGDVVVFASDGLVEAPAAAASRVVVPTGSAPADRVPGSANGPRRAASEAAMFGFGQLARVASDWATRAASADAIAEGIWSTVSRWNGGDFQHDDVTLVVLRVGDPVRKE